jgi:hypothetical protein
MVTEEQQINNPVKLTLKGIGKVIDVAAGGTVCMVLNGKNRNFFKLNLKITVTPQYTGKIF